MTKNISNAQHKSCARMRYRKILSLSAWRAISLTRSCN